MKKLTILIIPFLLLNLVLGYTQELTYEINVSSPDNNTITITFTGGNEITYQCNLIRNDSLPRDKKYAYPELNGIKYTKTIDLTWTTNTTLKIASTDTEYLHTCPDIPANHAIKYDQEINDPQKNSDIQRILDLKSLSSCESNTSLLLQQLTDCNQRNDQCQTERGHCQGKLDAYTQTPTSTTQENITCQEQLLITTNLYKELQDTSTKNQNTLYTCMGELKSETEKNTSNMMWAFLAGLIAYFVYLKWFGKKQGIGGHFGDLFTGRPPGGMEPPPI